MEKRLIELTLDTATRWYNGTDTGLKALAVQTFPELAKKQLPKTWEELGHRQASWSNIEQADAVRYLAKLTQLREVYRDGWVPDWTDKSVKSCIYYSKNEIRREKLVESNIFLSFQDEKTRDLFFENFKDLIEKASPLLF